MRYNRVSALRFKEGYSYPIENEILIESDALYNQSLLERDTNTLWTTKKDNSEIFRYFIIAGVVAVVGFIILQFFKQGG